MAARWVWKGLVGLAALLTVANGMPLMSAHADVATASQPSVASAWGDNNDGEVGDGSNATARLTPQTVVSLGSVGVTQVAAGCYHTLVLRADGSVYAWGYDFNGQLGDGGTTNQPAPIAVARFGPQSGVVQVVAGCEFSGVLKSDGAVLLWGGNTYGELGNGTTISSATPVTPTGLGAGSGVVALAAGDNHILALKGDGTVLAWGQNNFGQVGNGSTLGTAPPNATTPTQVSGFGPGSGVSQIAARYARSMALISSGAVYAWGYNQEFEAYDTRPTTGTAYSIVPFPHQVASLGPASGVTAIAAGLLFSLARLSNGTVEAWGDDSVGELGDGHSGSNGPDASCGWCRATPQPVPGLGKVLSMAAGYTHAVAILANGGARAWGSNAAGQLGDGSTINRPSPVAVYGILTPQGVVAAGASFTVALTAAPPLPQGVAQAAVGTSLYVDNLTGTYASDSSALSTAGCHQAAVTPGNGRATVILDFFSQAADPSGTLGVRNPANGQFVSDAYVVAMAEQYITGFTCTLGPSGAQLQLVVGTDNAGVTDNSHGQDWASVVQKVIAFVQQYPALASRILVAGGSNIRLAWNTASNTRAWVNGFYTPSGMSRVPLYDYGDAGACPSSGPVLPPPGAACGNGWTQDDLDYVSWAAFDAFPAPQLSAADGSQAAQWAELAAYGTKTYGGYGFDVVLTQQRACLQGQTCTSGTAVLANTPQNAEAQLQADVNANPVTAGQGTVYAWDPTDVEYASQPDVGALGLAQGLIPCPTCPTAPPPTPALPPPL